MKKMPRLWHRVMFDGRLNHGGHKVTVSDALADELKRAGHELPNGVLPDAEPPPIIHGKDAFHRVPNKAWPWWAKLLRLMAIKRDRGLGDVLDRLLIWIGGNLYKKWHLRKHGRPCKCNARQARLNARFPLVKTAP